MPLFHPRIYLPLRLISDCPKKDLRYILLHELQHDRQKDNLLNLFKNFSCVFYWFNPAVWYALREMRIEREIACDTSIPGFILDGIFLKNFRLRTGLPADRLLSKYMVLCHKYSGRAACLGKCRLGNHTGSVGNYGDLELALPGLRAGGMNFFSIFVYNTSNKENLRKCIMKNEICTNQADYSKVAGDRILPFLFTLDLTESILYPGEGQKQKFCYTVDGIGQDTSEYADLSHFLLGICGNITRDDISDLSVILHGEEQTVIWGENVEIKTPDHPDNPTGCTGLKFDFPLDKVEGRMHLCMTMAEPFAVGPVNICLFGGNTTATGLTICGPVCGGTESCSSTFFQKETVCVPVVVTPFAKPGDAKATCCGKPKVTPNGKCSGGRTSCTFTVTQDLCIEIPISFGADIRTGDALVQCGDVSQMPCDCSDVSSPEATEKRTSESDYIQEDYNGSEHTEKEERRLFYRK